MDDRYDQILLSVGLIDGGGFDYLGDATQRYSTTTWNDPNHTYRSWGNDGTSYNQSLRIVGNTMVGATIAQALVTSAGNGGHLPVLLDLLVPPHVDSIERIDFGQVPLGSVAEADLFVWNAGDVALWSAGGIADLGYTLLAGSGFSAPAGEFVEPAGGGVASHTITMDTSIAGPLESTLLITSNAPDEPLRLVELVGEVVGGCDPCDMNCDGDVNAFDIEPFLDLLFDPKAVPCDICTGDVNADGVIDAFDIEPFLACLFP
jgi:hypothetical protein